MNRLRQVKFLRRKSPHCLMARSRDGAKLRMKSHSAALVMLHFSRQPWFVSRPGLIASRILRPLTDPDLGVFMSGYLSIAARRGGKVSRFAASSGSLKHIFACLA